MKISIVTISYNQVIFLEQCIQSVINQDYPELEYIIVDPGSTDGSRDIIERYKESITKIILEPDEGPADGLNKGFSKATGEIFGFLNADDTLLPGALKTVSSYFRDEHNVDVVMGNGFIVDVNDNIIWPVLATKFTVKGYFYGYTNFLQQGTFFSKQAFFNVGGFNSKNRTCWDGELFLRMAESGCRFLLINENMANFRLYKDSITGSKRLQEMLNVDNERLFMECFGRNKRPIDRWYKIYFRILKWITSRKAIFLKLYYFLKKLSTKALIQ